jgi:hypothetical protein
MQSPWTERHPRTRRFPRCLILGEGWHHTVVSSLTSLIVFRVFGARAAGRSSSARRTARLDQGVKLTDAAGGPRWDSRSPPRCLAPRCRSTRPRGAVPNSVWISCLPRFCVGCFAYGAPGFVLRRIVIPPCASAMACSIAARRVARCAGMSPPGAVAIANVSSSYSRSSAGQSLGGRLSPRIETSAPRGSCADSAAHAPTGEPPHTSVQPPRNLCV